MTSRLPKAPTSKASSSFGSSESLTTSDTASSVDIGSKSLKTSIPKAGLSLKLSSDSVDDFAQDEKVWVNGSRPGIIRFIGETKFAPGKWIGVQLTSPDGKNDGTVAGVRYFACPNNCGVFVKPQRLTKAPMPESVFQKRLASPARTEKDLPASLANLGTDSDSASDITHVSSALKNSPFLMGPNGQSVGLGNGGGGGPGTGTNARIGSFRIGDRVLVNASSGTKLGTLMFLGETDFAAGQWAGIELDEPVGKNDGSVAGKRYFDCKMKFGLFAPLHKISAAPLSALSKTKKSSGLSSKTSSISKLTGRLSRADSQESVSSVASSVASSATGRQSRIRLGITSLKSVTSPVASGSPSLGTISSSPSSATKNTIAGTNAAILDALKEKDEHIGQLLRERDLERGEFSRVAMQADELEERVAALQAENARIATEADEEICEMKRLNSEYEEVQLKLSTRLEEERRRVEDLQFRFEEETLAKSELESFVTDLKKQVDELKNKLISGSSSSIEMEMNSKVTNELRTNVKQAEDRLEEKENEIFALQEEMTRKDEMVFQMEASNEKRKAEFSGLQLRIKEIEHELDISNQRSQRYMETIDELNKRLAKNESENSQMRAERTNLMEEIKEYENKVFALEEKLIEEVNQVKEVSDQVSNKQIARLETDLDRKTRSEKMLEERLVEAKSRHDKFESEVNSLADQLRDLRRTNEEENRRRKNAEDKVAMLTANNQSLNSKIEDLIQKSGNNSDLLSKLNDELVAKQNEFNRKERQMETEIESLLRDKEAKDTDIRNLRVDIENQKSVISRFEKKERDVEKLIQANQNELKLTRSDAEEKQRLVDELRTQLKEVNSQINSITKSQLSSKDEFESQLAKMTRDYNESKKEMLTLNEELRKYKDKCAEMETERDLFQQDAQRHQKVAEEREKSIEKAQTDITDVKEQFEDYKKRIELELESSKQNGLSALDDMSVELDRVKGQTRQTESENGLFREENRALATKVEELQEDIEGLKRRHAEVLNEFEFECKQTEQRADAAEKMAFGRMEEMQNLEHRQNIALEEYRSMAETEKKIMEQKLDELEAKIKEQSRQLQQEQQRRIAEDFGSHEQQIEFLNSVIVDMQKKNDELRNRVQVLEEIGLGEFEHSFQSQVETTRRTTASTASAGTMTNGHIRNLRKYCDICEIFDSHDTEDCPQQASVPNGHEPGHTYNAIGRDEARPYCTLCERFGHQLENCPDNETF